MCVCVWNGHGRDRVKLLIIPSKWKLLKWMNWNEKQKLEIHLFLKLIQYKKHSQNKKNWILAFYFFIVERLDVEAEKIASICMCGCESDSTNSWFTRFTQRNIVRGDEVITYAKRMNSLTLWTFRHCVTSNLVHTPILMLECVNFIKSNGKNFSQIFF